MQPTLLSAQESAGQGGRPVLVFLPKIGASLPTITWGFTAKVVVQVIVPTAQEEHGALLGDREEGKVSRTFYSISLYCLTVSAPGHTDSTGALGAPPA